MNHDMQIQYPSLLRPWEKYHHRDSAPQLDPEESLYNNFMTVAKRTPQALAYIDYRTGRKVTYTQLLSEADAFADGLSALGFTGNNRVGVLGFNCCADPVVLLGANKCGAAVVFISPDGSSADIAASIRYVDVLVIQNILAELEPLINTSSIPVIIYGPCPHLPSDHCYSYEDFLSNGVGKYAPAMESRTDRDAVVIFSSGSTGASKPIVHSNRTATAAVRKMLASDFPINNSSYLIKVIPSHIGLGSITTMLTALLSGVTYIQISGLPDPATDMLKQTLELTFELITHFKAWKRQNGLSDNKGLVLFAAPIYARYYRSRLDEIEDLSVLGGILLGGSKIPKEELDAMGAAFRSKGLQVPICNGYGRNELGGAVALNTVHYNKNGSAGYPVAGTNVRIVDQDTLEEVGFHTVGLVLEQSDSQFIRYLDMPERTAQATITLPDGTTWYNSTDLGYMDEDGFLFITGRTTRVVIRFDHKISMDVIEEKLKAIPEIEDAAIVTTGSGEEITAFVVCKHAFDPEKMLEQMRSRKTHLSSFEIPDRITIVPELPRMNNGKIDYVLLTERAKSDSGQMAHTIPSGRN